MYGLYAHTVVRKADEYKLLAAMHGIDVEKGSEKKNENSNEEDTPQQPQQPRGQQLPIFGDPESYKHLSDEEKENETRRMMSQHKAWQQKGIV